MVAFQGGSLAEGGMEKQEEMWSCPLCENDGGGASVLTRGWNLMAQSYLSKVSPGQQCTLILRLLLCGQTDNSDNGVDRAGSWDGKDRGLGLEENKVCTKQLVLQHIKLVLVKTSTNIGEELPTESRAQQAPGGFGGAREELLILQVWEEGRWLRS